MGPRGRGDRLEAWDIFILRHQRYPNVVIHIFAASFFWFSPILAIIYSKWWWLGFFGSGLLGSLGHAIFRDGSVDVREATSRMQVVYFSTWMCVLFLCGRWRQEINMAEAQFEKFKSGKIPSAVEPELFLKLASRYQQRNGEVYE